MTIDTDSDEQLVKRAVKGDRAAFAALITRAYDMIFHTAYKWCGDREDAEDIAQEVCIRLGSSLTKFNGRSKFSTWLYRVVLNATRDHQRRRQSDIRKLADWADEPSRPRFHVPPEAGSEFRLSELWQAVAQLPERQRDAVMLVYAEELNHAEAAEIMGCAEGTVSSNIHDAKKKLKGVLMQEAGT